MLNFRTLFYNYFQKKILFLRVIYLANPSQRHADKCESQFTISIFWKYSKHCLLFLIKCFFKWIFLETIWTLLKLIDKNVMLNIFDVLVKYSAQTMKSCEQCWWIRHNIEIKWKLTNTFGTLSKNKWKRRISDIDGYSTALCPCLIDWLIMLQREMQIPAILGRLLTNPFVKF